MLTLHASVWECRYCSVTDGPFKSPWDANLGCGVHAVQQARQSIHWRFSVQLIPVILPRVWRNLPGYYEVLATIISVKVF